MRFADDVPYETLAGLILVELGRFPLAGEVLIWENYRLCCVKVTPTAVRKVRIEPVTQEKNQLV